MKITYSIALVISILALLFAIPYVRQKLFVTDESAAAALSQLESSEWGARIVGCINLETAAARLWSENASVELTAYHNHGGPWDESFYVISGLVGWHVTWIAGVPLDTRPVVAYDMNGVSGGSMWSREVPTRVIDAFVRCGVEYKGRWPGETPPGF